ncbi:hypothetical protein GCM10010191_59100 [Actinomadura vinacea]|uniref:DUF397 domain-containing protein n=1 Tax=Actinomadura vinacea TaxID=115336 RepID=A0ABN3JT70_9ACTN
MTSGVGRTPSRAAEVAPVGMTAAALSSHSRDAAKDLAFVRFIGTSSRVQRPGMFIKTNDMPTLCSQYCPE